MSRSKDDPWYSTPRHKRKRKPIALTLSDEVRGWLDIEAKQQGVSRSEVVESALFAVAFDRAWRLTLARDKK